MLPLITNLTALLVYSAASVYLLHLIRKPINHQKKTSKGIFLGIVMMANGFHAIGIYQLMAIETSVDLGIHKMTSFVAFVINLLLLISCLLKPLHNLFILVLPLSIACIAISITVDQPPLLLSAPPGVTIHIFLSITAYSVLSMAVLQGLLWTWQNQQLKSGRLNGAVRLLPPLQTMELLLFELLWAGLILLTLGIAVGFFYLDNIFTQHLTHKTVLSIFAWFTFSSLLWGRHSRGWRGKIAIKWLLSGFCLLMLAYFGSKLVLEVILNN